MDGAQTEDEVGNSTPPRVTPRSARCVQSLKAAIPGAQPRGKIPSCSGPGWARHVAIWRYERNSKRRG